MPDEVVDLRYLLNDVDMSIAFYTKLRGFELLRSAATAGVEFVVAGDRRSRLNPGCRSSTGVAGCTLR